MKVEATKTTVIGFVVVAALAILFWLLLLAPKREEVKKLSATLSTLQSEVNGVQARVKAGLAAKRQFPQAYRELVVLGKAVPNNSDTASLLVQLNRLAQGAHTDFQAISLSSGGGASTESASPEGGGEELPIGASVGPTGLPTMAYALNFDGSFFDVANFIHAVDSQVETVHGKVDAKGRLITINSFTLAPSEGSLSSKLNATFNVSTYVTPPSQGLTGGATATGPEGSAQ